MNKLIFVLLGLLVLTVSVSACVDLSDDITYGTMVQEDGDDFIILNDTVLCTDTYNLQGTIRFNEDNLELDCNGSVLDGPSSGNGIYILNVENITIKNCTITDYYMGISISHGNATITDSVIHSNSARGISIYNSDYNYIYNNTIHSNIDGIYLLDAHYSLLENNAISSNTDYGIRMSSNTKGNRIINNLISENGMWDIEPTSNCFNIITNNIGSGGSPILYVNETMNIENGEYSELILCGADNSIINNVNVTGSDTLKNNGISIRDSDNVYINNTNSSNNYVGLKTSGPLNGLVVENTVLNNNADDGLGAHYDTRDMQTTNIRACGNGGYDINDRLPLTNIYTDATCDNSNPEGICSFTCDTAPVLQPACLDLDDPTTYGTVLSGSYIYGDVILCNKTYSITNSLGVAVNNAVIDCNGSTLTSNGADTFLKIDNHENTELKNCVFEGFEKAVEVNARNTVIENNTFNNVNYAVFSSQVSPMQMDLTIRDNTFTNSEKTLYLFRLKGLTIENNAFTNLNGDIPPQILQCEDVVISDNLFEDGESTALLIQGVIRGAIENNIFEEYISFLSMSSSQDIKINNNTFNNSRNGYALSFSGVENTLIVNNTLSNVYSGFYTFGSSDVSFMDNELSVKGDLMELDGISKLNIFGNTMAKEDGYKSYTADNPILITDSSDVCVENNNIMDFRSYNLMKISSVDRLHFIDNVIGNIFYESYTHYPTVLFSGQDFVISGNEFFNMEGGVHIGASAVVMTDNLIHDVNRDALNIYPNKENIQISDLEIYNANSTALSAGYLIDSNIDNVLIYDSWKGAEFTGIQPYTNTKLNNLTMYNNSNYLSFPAGISGLELTNLTIASEATGQTTVLWEEIIPAEGYISSDDITVGIGFASVDSPDVPMLNVQANISIQMACVSPDSILVYKKDGFPQTLADIIENGTLYTPVSKACTSLNTFTFTVAGFSGYGAEQEVMNINAIPSIVRLGDDVLLNVTNNNGDPINASNVTVDLPGGSTIEDLTGIDGILILTTNETGIHTATARKQGYFNAQTTYEVLAPLSIAYSPANPEEDNSITITITSLGNPINDSNVTIEYGGMEVYSALTDVAGQVVYTPSTHGTYTINAVHDGYWNASVTVSVSEDDDGGKKKKDKGNGNSGTPIPPPYIPPAPDVPVENDTIDEDETQGGAEEPVIDPKEEAREAIQDAVDAINKARGEGKDTSKAETLLLDAQQAYVDGDYPTAILLAEQAKDEAEGAEVTLEEEEEFNQPGPTVVEDVIETIEEEAPFGGLEICFGAVLMLAVVLSKLLA
ncbi:right-handed parallel beta-helix repeat-containing protein [Candidatus Micrarchaeota archaeon]|nr:right-handed parallel beta-helix repeat-containing protein [Candidatus Micrarchaeota archaeon]